MIDHELRKSGIGASEVAAVVGLHPYLTRFGLYCKKLNLVKEEPATEVQRRGKYFERGVCDWYRDLTGKDVEWFDQTITHPVRHWQKCSPDAWIIENGRRDAELQIKTVNWRNVEEYGEPGSDDIPPHVILQCAWTMSTADTQYSVPAALCGLDDLRIYEVRRDPKIEDVLLEEAEKFWFDHIVARVPPEIDASDTAALYLKQRFPRNVRQLRTATPEEHEILVKLKNADEQWDVVNTECVTLENRIKEKIGYAGGLLDGNAKITWTKNEDATGTDYETVAKALHAEALRLGSQIELSDLLKANQVVTRVGPRVLRKNWGRN